MRIVGLCLLISFASFGVNVGRGGLPFTKSRNTSESMVCWRYQHLVMNSGSPLSQCSAGEPQEAYAATGYFWARCPCTTSPNFPTDNESPTIRMLGGGTYGLFADFCLPLATRTKLPTPTRTARSNSIGWSTVGQAFLMRMLRVFSFILDPDKWLKID